MIRFCPWCNKRLRTSERKRTYPHTIENRVPARYAMRGGERVEIEPEHVTRSPDYKRPEITRREVSPEESPYYPFCTLRCGWRYARRDALAREKL